ncbi:hypothetical protein QR680_001990 [Steinernema hermaphroditum]|uniref:Uncharacterized protein n=1 Tax=Steinernema hermaphroditum TaxID=289476 RepID=A0AA39H2V4_9BILA|nr:hypothetical protein QR680_001990 [Steinernema hermaphroditum]
MWNVGGVRRYATAFCVAFCFVVVVESQWPNYEVVKTRLPGKCERGEFDCLFGPCIPSFKFNDGHPDCLDGSDEFCFAGHIKCGRQCVDISYAGECLANSNCDGTPSAPSFCASTKTKLCERSDVMRCKGYNECVLRKWLLDDNDDCLDGSDSDSEYVALMNGIYFEHYARIPTYANSANSYCTTHFISILIAVFAHIYTDNHKKLYYSCYRNNYRNNIYESIDINTFYKRTAVFRRHMVT